ncbi:MAG: septum formation family protein [Salana multivorans]|nr:septum formation family protein [Salana multivorans]
MSRHAGGEDGGLPEIPKAPDASPEEAARRRRSPYSARTERPAPAPGGPGQGGPPGVAGPTAEPWAPPPGVAGPTAEPWAPPPGPQQAWGVPGAAGTPPASIASAPSASSEAGSTTLAAGAGLAIPAIERAPLDAVSVAAVATGAIGLGPVAVVLGALGLRRTTRQWRRSPAIAGVGLGLGILGTLGWVGLGVAAGLGAFSGPDLTATPGDVAAPRTVHASALAAGNCVETVPPQQEVGELHLVPCAEPHLAQVLAVTDHPSDTYPGQDPALETATEWCSGILAEHGFAADSFLAWPIVPTPAAWDEGVRAMSCSARSTLGQITGDLS